MKRPFKFAAILATAVCFAFALPKTEDAKVINVVIDAGHGGKDHSATYADITEKQITDQIAAKINELNKGSNIAIHLHV